MHRAIVEACLPWLGLLLAGGLALVVLVCLAGARLESARLVRLHRDQEGAVQSLSFVLTLPLFIMVMMFIVQVSQLMIANVVVQYAAYAAARAAIVWIPAQLGEEAPNFMGTTVTQGEGPASGTPSPGDAPPGTGVATPILAEQSPKLTKIAMAAKWACVPISPSRGLGLTVRADLAEILDLAYRSFARNSTIPSGAISRRLKNKLAYAFAKGQAFSTWSRTASAWGTDPHGESTYVNVYPYRLAVAPFTRDPVAPGEIGWQDPITVRVIHYLVLLPGPGNMLFRYVSAGASQGMGNNFGYLSTPGGKVPVYRLVADATLVNEGQKSAVPYVYPLE